MLLELGVEQIFAHVTRFLDTLEPQLELPGWSRLRDRERASGSLCFRAPAGTDLVAWERALHREGVQVATPDGCLRLAPQWPNSLEEVPLVVEAFRKVQRSLA